MRAGSLLMLSRADVKHDFDEQRVMNLTNLSEFDLQFKARSVAPSVRVTESTLLQRLEGEMRRRLLAVS